MIPIKYKKRMFEAHRELWVELLVKAAPQTDIGRGKTNSSQIPNLGHTQLKDILLQRYKKKFCIFTDCATDALDLVVSCVDAPAWYVPSYTWFSPVNAIAKSGKELRFLDVHMESRMVDYSQYDPRFPIIVPHVDGRASPAPPERKAFVLEDAAQSPLNKEIGFGDAVVLSFGSSKRLGLLGQGGCILTDDEQLAKRLQRLTVFGLEGTQDLIEPGYKSFFDPYNSLCTQEIFRLYDERDYLARIDRIIDAYNDASGVSNPSGLERYTIQVRDRTRFRSHLDERGIETRVWFKSHSARHPAYANLDIKGADKLEVSDLVSERSVDVPLNEYLTDREVEQICDALKSSKDLIIPTEELL